jgi:hypothetical protein
MLQNFLAYDLYTGYYLESPYFCSNAAVGASEKDR